MQRMRPNLRLLMCAVIIVASAAYAVLVAQDPQTASAVSSGYIALLVSVFFLVNVWKKP